MKKSSNKGASVGMFYLYTFTIFVIVYAIGWNL